MPINWFGETIWIPWQWGLLFVLPLIFLVMFIAACFLTKNTYACPICGHCFRKKWYHLIFSAHTMGDRWLRCPQCRKRDWCSLKEHSL